MLEILGFKFDFKYLGGKAFKKVRNDIVKTTSEWGKATKGIKKNLRMMLIDFRAVRGTMKNWALDVKNSGVSMTDVIDDIAAKFGGVAGVIADTLFRPGAALAALGTTAFIAGKQVEKSMVNMRRETNLTADQLANIRNIAVAVTDATGANVSQTMHLGEAFAAAQVPIGNYNELMRLGVDANRHLKIDTGELADQMIRLRRDFGKSPEEIRNYFNTVIGSAKAAGVSIGDLSSRTNDFMDMVIETMPNVKGAIDMAPQVLASLNGIKGADGIVKSLFEAINNRASTEFIGMQNLAAQAGGDTAAAFVQAMNDQDAVGGLKAFMKGVGAVRGDLLESMKIGGKPIADIFGVSPGTLAALKRIDPLLMNQVAASAALAKSQDAVNKETTEIATVSEKWRKIWAKIERIALPFGEILVTVFSKILDFFAPILTAVGKVIDKVGVIGQVAILVGLAVMTWSKWLTPLIMVTKLIATNMITAAFGANAGAVGMQRMAGSAVVLDAATGTMAGNVRGASGFMGMFAGGLMNSLRSIGTMIMRFGKVAGIIGLIIGAIEIVDIALKEAFGTGLWDMVSTVFGFIGDVLGGIAKVLGGIIGGLIKAVVWLGTLGNVNLFADPINPVSPTVKKVATTNGGATEKSATWEGGRDSESTSALDGLLDSPPDLRKSYGTDDLIEAIYGAAESTNKQLARMAANSPMSPSSDRPQRFSSIPDPLLSGAR